MQPSFSGLFVTCAYLPHTTLPDGVTRPNSDTFTSITEPFVMTPSPVYILPCGFFLTEMIGRQKVAFSSGWVTWAFLKRSAMGRMKRSIFGIRRVKVSPTNVTLFTKRFHDFLPRLPEVTALSISSSDTVLTFSIGTAHFPAFSFLFCFSEFDNTLARSASLRSIRKPGRAFLGPLSFTRSVVCFSSCSRIFLRISAFSAWRAFCASLAFIPRTRFR
ncbi:40S ribosomal protein S8, putative [Leishmania tarentolae]|uniref:40S ribosomal protein S8, putative n=1 Tax=Leishmania tarentolae TaxID=5689 RepID=A0A640KXL3_LEITA|nr:40S ribosomal protein S8, putative [Leishmania tarentolae]